MTVVSLMQMRVREARELLDAARLAAWIGGKHRRLSIRSNLITGDVFGSGSTCNSRTILLTQYIRPHIRLVKSTLVFYYLWPDDAILIENSYDALLPWADLEGEKGAVALFFLNFFLNF